MARIDRREFLAGAGAAAAGALACGTGVGLVADHARRLADDPTDPANGFRRAALDPRDWSSVRESFDLSPDRIHMSALYIASHPSPVRDAIAEHRRGLDQDPATYLRRNERALTFAALDQAGRYMGADPREIALTDSTTMGLGLLYTGLRLEPGDEILTTEHDFYATHESVRMAAAETGATVRRIRLHGSEDLGEEGIGVDADRLADRIAREVRPATRVVALTWVHSSTGLKLPLARVAEAVRARAGVGSAGRRPLLCVDGVHGFGVEDVGMEETGFDFFVSGCHKWAFGPRGTGLVWGRGDDAWSRVRPSIPSFLDSSAWAAWSRGETPPGSTTALRATPGGFKPFEHRWALAPAFGFLTEIGRDRIAERTHALARRLKEGLIRLPRARLVTPLSETVSSGIVCFDVEGMSADAVVRGLADRGIVATVTPYAVTHARLAPCIANTPDEIDAAVSAVGEIAA